MNKLHGFLMNGASVLEYEKLLKENTELRRKLKLLGKALQKEKIQKEDGDTSENVLH